MNKFEESMKEAENSLKEFHKYLTEINKQIKAVELLFQTSPVYSFTFPIVDKLRFVWSDGRLKFSNGESEKPFIEWDAATRYQFSDLLPNFIQAMNQEIHIILN